MPAQHGLSVDDRHGRAIDQAIDLLGLMMRDEQDSRRRRADVMRSRLSNASRETLRDRVADEAKASSTKR